MEANNNHPQGCSRGCSRYAAVISTVLATIWLAAALYVHCAWGESTWQTAVITYAPPHLYLIPLLTAALLCLAAGMWRVSLFCLIMALAGLHILFQPVYLPQRPAQANQAPVRVVSWNVAHKDGNPDIVRATLHQLQPDIVCLQEARLDVFRTAMDAPDQAFHRETKTFTTGRIVARREVPLGGPPNWRDALETDIELPQGRVKVLNVHMVSLQFGRFRPDDRTAFARTAWYARQRNMEAIIQWLQETEGPRLLVGDFNTPPHSDFYRELKAHAVDAFVSGWGLGLTFHRQLPLWRIDHIWCVGEVQPLSCTALDGGTSDHRLVTADVILTGEQQ